MQQISMLPNTKWNTRGVFFTSTHMHMNVGQLRESWYTADSPCHVSLQILHHIVTLCIEPHLRLHKLVQGAKMARMWTADALQQ